ncbi:MAG: autotransporter domain-containing protein [Elusimicrobiota bacterium]|jgi:outer membrane protein OmpA-like peptidoglycan-associated protein|nr:autotransporter domain-containing protein [Elusimicrobiota bacterium]
MKRLNKIYKKICLTLFFLTISVNAFSLDEKKGLFAADALTAGARTNVILDALANTDENGIWFSANSGALEINNKRISAGKFKSSASGFILGAGIFKDSGFYASYNKLNLRQDDSRAKTDDIEFGLYSKTSISNLIIKGALSAGYQDFTLDTPDKKKPTVSFNTPSVRFAGEAGYELLNKSFILKPFAGISAGYVRNGKITELGNSSSNLIVNAHSYTRVDSRLGIEFGQRQKRINWKVKAYAGFLIKGNEEQYILSSVIDESDQVKVETSKEDDTFGGIALGMDFGISPYVDLFVNTMTEKSENYLNYRISAGINFKFNPSYVKSTKIEAAKESAEAKLQKQDDKKSEIQELLTVELEIEQNTVKQNRYTVGLFSVGSYDLSNPVKGNIKKIAAFIKQKGFNRIIIEGHADGATEKNNSMKLSQERAKAIFNEFLRNGILTIQMEANGFGARIPVGNNNTEEGSRENRRVDIFIE